MTMNQLVARDIFIRTTQPNGKATVTQHRVWDAERFLAARRQDAAERARKDKVEPDVVSIASADDYRTKH